MPVLKISPNRHAARGALKPIGGRHSTNGGASTSGSQAEATRSTADRCRSARQTPDTRIAQVWDRRIMQTRITIIGRRVS